MKTILDIAKELEISVTVINDNYTKAREGSLIVLNNGNGVRLSMKELHNMFDMLGGRVLTVEPEYTQYSNPDSYRVLAYVVNQYEHESLIDKLNELYVKYDEEVEQIQPVQFRAIKNDSDLGGLYV